MRLIGDEPAALLELLAGHGFELRSNVPYRGKAWLLINDVGGYRDVPPSQMLSPSHFHAIADQFTKEAKLGRTFFEMIAERA